MFRKHSKRSNDDTPSDENIGIESAVNAPRFAGAWWLPYMRSATLFAGASAVMYAADLKLVRYGFPWALVYLLAVAVVANFWGARPALLVLALSAIFGDLIVPDLHISYFYGLDPSWRVRAMRTLLFVACGLALIWVTERARNLKERSEQRRRVVEALQRMILPEHFETMPGYDLSGFYMPAHKEDEVGGDFYDFFPIGNGTYGLMIGDVMGKGKEAAASTALLRYSVRAFTSLGIGPAAALKRLNSMIENQHFPFDTATIFLGILDPVAGELRFSSAGHEPPMLYRAQGIGMSLSTSGMMLGVGIECEYDEDMVVLHPGDHLLLMTDGATEARSEQGQFLTCDGVWEMLKNAVREDSTESALSRLTSDLVSYIGHSNRDDIALLLLRRTSHSIDAGIYGTAELTDSMRHAKIG